MPSKKSSSASTAPLYLGHPNMSISESSLPVQYANWQEELILRRKLNTITSNEKQKLREIYTEQRLMLKRFNTKLCNSRLIQARMAGDKELERDLRNQMILHRSGSADLGGVLAMSPTRGQLSKRNRTATERNHTTSAIATRSTTQGRHMLTALPRKVSLESTVTQLPGAYIRRPNTVAGAVAPRVLSDVPLVNQKSQEDTSINYHKRHGKIIQSHFLVEPCVPPTRRPSAHSLDQGKTIPDSSEPRIQDGPYAQKIKMFCRSLRPLSVKSTAATDSDYYAQLLDGAGSKPVKVELPSRPQTARNISRKPSHLRSLTFKSIKIPSTQQE